MAGRERLRRILSRSRVAVLQGERMVGQVGYVLAKLDWMQSERIWPNGLRYLWTDAFGLVLLVSLYRQLRETEYLQAAEHLVAEVERVLGRRWGIRIGEAPDRDGQYFHTSRCGFTRWASWASLRRY